MGRGELGGGWVIASLPLAALAEAALVRRLALFERLPWLPDLHTPDEDTRFWTEVLAPECTILGAMASERILGMIAFNEHWIEQLYVLPEAQGLGIGSALLERAKQASSALSLWTFQANHPARRFYERHGFAPSEQTDGSGNEEQEPDVLYRWKRA
jgi:GNAT superfamily N-acetyltransferase